MGSFSGPEIVTNGLVFKHDMANPKSFRGKPTTNLAPNLGIINIQGAPTLTYVGVEDGWKKYSLNGTWSAGTYPYSIGTDGVTFTGGVTYSSGVFIKTNVPGKFANLFGGMNYVNEPMNNGGTSFSISQPDGSIFVGRTGFQYTSTTAQTGYILSQPVVGQSFSSATDFVYIKQGQVETGSFTTPFVAGTRSTTQTLLDLTGRNTVTATSLTYASNGTFSFNGTSDYIDTGNTFTFSQSGQFSAEVWMKILDHSDRPSAAAGIIGKGHYYDNGWDLFLLNNNSIYFEASGDPTRQGLVHAITPVLALSTWYHCIATYNNGAMSVYLNGVLVATQTYSGPGNFSNSNNVLIGRRFNDASRSLRGEVPVAKIYNRALTGAEVLQNFNANRGRFGI